MRSLCMIPARGGSKRIPRKNLRVLGGHTLLQRAMDAAVDAGVFDQVIVSSDDPEIESAVRQHGRAYYHAREASLANDTARVPEVLHRFLREMPESDLPDTVSVVLPTCPFRTKEHIHEAFQRFTTENPGGFLVSITRYDFPPQFAVKWVSDPDSPHALGLIHPEVYATTTRSQSVEPLWHPNGAIYLCNARAFLKSASLFASPLIGYEMTPEESFDIDWPHQFAIAEAMIAARETS